MLSNAGVWRLAEEGGEEEGDSLTGAAAVDDSLITGVEDGSLMPGVVDGQQQRAVLRRAIVGITASGKRSISEFLASTETSTCTHLSASCALLESTAREDGISLVRTVGK